MFHRFFGELKISASLLHRTYKEHGIKFKFIKKIKKEIDYSNQYYKDIFVKMHKMLFLARSWGMKVVFLDEAVFTFNTFKTKSWASSYSSIKVNDYAIKVKTQALICAISEDQGLEAYAIHPKSIKTEEFIKFIEQLAEKFGGIDFAVFMDNLQVHKTKDSKLAFERLKVTDIFNVPYSPQFNGIESYFSLVKNEYKKMLLQRVMKGTQVDAVQMIKESINLVSDVKVKRCVVNGIDAVMKQS